MTDDSGADKTAVDRTGDPHPGSAQGNGPTEIPEETAASESDLSLSAQVAARESEQGDK